MIRIVALWLVGRSPRAVYSLRQNFHRWTIFLWLIFILTGTAFFPRTSLAGSPTVAITSPTASTTLAGTIFVTASVTDAGTGVAGAQLQVDGIPFGVGSNTSPYTFSLDTTQFANGAHSLTVSASDLANNTGFASPVAVAFANSVPGNPAQLGTWSGTVPLPLVSVHAALLPGGKILMSDGQTLGASAFDWDPATNNIDSVPAPVNIFCNGLVQTGDGKILVVGGHQGAGHVGIPAANLFDPSNETWTQLSDMNLSAVVPDCNDALRRNHHRNFRGNQRRRG
jgi:hypothetical protein